MPGVDRTAMFVTPLVTNTLHLEASVRSPRIDKVSVSFLVCPSDPVLTSAHTHSSVYLIVSLLSNSLGTSWAQPSKWDRTRQGTASENFLGVQGGRLKLIFITRA